MYHPAELVLRSYKPLKLEKGMWFVNKIFTNTVKEVIAINVLDSVPHNEEEYVQINGYPVEPCILINETVVAEPEELAWWDEGDDVDELRTMTLKETMNILNNFDGMCEIEMEEVNYDDDEAIDSTYLTPSTYDGLITLRYPVFEDEGDFEIEEEENSDNDDAIMYFSNVIDRIKTWLFGKRTEQIYPFIPGCTTCHPVERPSFNVWCRQLNVSVLAR